MQISLFFKSRPTLINTMEKINKYYKKLLLAYIQICIMLVLSTFYKVTNFTL